MAKNTYIPRDELIDMNEELNKVRDKAVKELMKYPGVVSAGLGMVITNGELQRELCFRVSVVKKKPIKSLKKAERIPKTIFGFKTDVVDVPKPVPLIDQRKYNPLLGGCQIQNHRSAGFGTLGCFARRNIDGKIVALSNWHVMLSKHDRFSNERISQPNFIGCTCCSCNEIGKVSAGFLDPTMDAAIAVLNGQENGDIPDIRYLNEIHSIGVIAGSESETLIGETVYKRGRTTKLTVGQIIDKDASFTIPYKQYNDHPISFVGQLTIFPSPPYTDMILGGDSGSVLINEHNKVVGLNFAGTDEKIRPRPAIILAHASPITPILSALGITILDSTFGSSGDKLGIPLSSSANDILAPTLQETLTTLKRQVKTYELGKYFLDVFNNHSSEVLSLIKNNREVMVSWNRYQGPAYMSHIMRSIKRGKAIPDQIHGISIQNLLLKMTSVLQRNGSKDLINDIEKNYLTVMQILGAGYSVEDWLKKLELMNQNLLIQRLDHA